MTIVSIVDTLVLMNKSTQSIDQQIADDVRAYAECVAAEIAAIQEDIIRKLSIRGYVEALGLTQPLDANSDEAA